jgi:hypothetical protein
MTQQSRPPARHTPVCPFSINLLFFPLHFFVKWWTRDSRRRIYRQQQREHISRENGRQFEFFFSFSMDLRWINIYTTRSRARCIRARTIVPRLPCHAGKTSPRGVWRTKDFLVEFYEALNFPCWQMDGNVCHLVSLYDGARGGGGGGGGG